MIAVYAIGGGAGHVTRARRVIDALGLRDHAVILATPGNPRAAGGIPLVEVPRSLEGDVAAHRAWLDGIECERMIVDVFPAGIQGELSRFDRVPLDFVGRLLRLDEYRRATNDAAWPQFETAYVVEEGAPEVGAKRVERLDLRAEMETAIGEPFEEGQSKTHGSVWWPAPSPALDHRGSWSQPEAARAGEGAGHHTEPANLPGTLVASSLGRPKESSVTTPSRAANPLAITASFWLIVHSGPAEEVHELMAYTRELTTARVLVATPCDILMPSAFERVDAFPVSHLYADAERIVSAAGFNVMLETEPWRDKHLILPFPRRFDDQFARAARRKSASTKI